MAAASFKWRIERRLSARQATCCRQAGNSIVPRAIEMEADVCIDRRLLDPPQRVSCCLLHAACLCLWHCHCLWHATRQSLAQLCSLAATSNAMFPQRKTSPIKSHLGEQVSPPMITSFVYAVWKYDRPTRIPCKHYEKVWESWEGIMGRVLG